MTCGTNEKRVTVIPCTCSSVSDDKWLLAAQESTFGVKWLMMARMFVSELVCLTAVSFH